MATETASVAEICAAAKLASRTLARLDDRYADAAVEGMARLLEERAADVLEANALDMEAGREAGLDAALLDRLELTPERVAGIAAEARADRRAARPRRRGARGAHDRERPELTKVSVPLGVVAVVYEARPNVTIDCSALCIKSGNAIVLRGSSTAAHSNAVLAEIARAAVAEAGLPSDAVSLVAGGGRDELRELATQDGVVDLIIPRGGEGLKAALVRARDGAGDLRVLGQLPRVRRRVAPTSTTAVAITLNAKVQRPSVCNAAETLLVHADAAAEFLPRALAELRESGVELRADARARALAGELGDSLIEATDEDWETEYHALILAVGVVDSVDEAIDHVNRY